MKRYTRPVIGGSVLAILASILFTLNAWANHSIVAGTVKCLDDGTASIVWTVRPDEKNPPTGVVVSSTGGILDGQTVSPSNTATATQPNAAPGTHKMVVTVKWSGTPKEESKKGWVPQSTNKGSVTVNAEDCALEPPPLCEDGSEPVNGECPVEPPPLCEDGSEPVNGECPVEPPPVECPEGTVEDASGNCNTPTPECPAGEVEGTDGNCLEPAPEPGAEPVETVTQSQALVCENGNWVHYQYENGKQVDREVKGSCKGKKRKQKEEGL